MKKVFSLLLAVVIAACCVSCSLSGVSSPKDAPDQTFTCEEMSITLTSAFEEAEYEGYTKCFDSSEAAVFVLREAKDLFEEEISFDDYVGLIETANASRNISDAVRENGLIFFEYNFTNPDSDIEYRYFATVHESDEAFWLVQFATETDQYDEYKDTLIKWAQSVTFA